MIALKRLLFASLLSSSLGLAACGGDDAASDGGNPDAIDEDGDGFTADEDCNDQNASIHPGAPDLCDGIDNDCNGQIDEMYDQDDDGWTTCEGDCRDNDPTSNPGSIEVVDGVDNDCDGIADNNTDQSDDDGDGYSEDQGDCNDDPDADGHLIGPNAIEVNETEDGEPEGVDNDCDGLIDEGPDPCPASADADDAALAMAYAVDACHGLQTARWRTDITIDPRSRGIFQSFGDTYVPLHGDDMGGLSSGIMGDASHPQFDGLSTGLGVSTSHPDPQGAVGCSSMDPSSVQDYSELELVLDVPTNAQAFSFDFNFMSIEFPEWVCSSFDDTFLAMLESQAFSGNVSFDAMGNRVSINVGFFDVCDTTHGMACTGDADLVGTGFEGNAGGGTGWLTTTAPVVPGEKVRLTFIIFDEGDSILDSAVLIDNFRWEVEAVDGPITVDRKITQEDGKPPLRVGR